MKKGKRVLSLLLSLLMLVPIVPYFDTIKINANAATDYYSELIWPVKNNYYISTLYHYYSIKNGGKHSNFTYGEGGISGSTYLDIPGDFSNEIVAATSGKVVYQYGYGKPTNKKTGGTAYQVVIEDANGNKTGYYHFSQVLVNTGDRVTKGQTIGYMGKTGNSFGVHLHFQWTGGDAWYDVYKDKYYDKITYASSVIDACKRDGKNEEQSRRATEFFEEYDIKYEGKADRATEGYLLHSQTSQILDGNNGRISYNITVPKEIIKGNPFDFDGTISSQLGITAISVLIFNNNNKCVQYSHNILGKENRFGYLESNRRSFNMQKLYSYSVVLSTLNFKKLTEGTYRLKVYVACEKVGILSSDLSKITSDDGKSVVVDGCEFIVKSSSKTAPKKAKDNASSNRELLTDKYGNTYYWYGAQTKVTSGTSTNATSTSGGSGYSGYSYYDASASYPTGTYKVKANGGLNARSKPTKNSTKISGWPNGSIIEVTATNGNWGYTSRGWVCLNYAIYQSAPVSTYVEPIHYNTGAYEVATSAGLNVHQGSDTDYTVIQTLANGTKFNVTETNGSWGFCKNLGGWVNLSYASYVGDPEAELPIPDAPTVSSSTLSEIPVGEVINVKWNAVDGADWYVAKLVDANTNAAIQTMDKLMNTEAAFTTPYAGTFNVTVTAANSQHSSHEAFISGIEAKAPVTVTFKDWDGKVLNTQEVTFGKDATVPVTPSRVGHTFKEWNGEFKNVRTNTTVTAIYSRNSYDVTFYDFDGTVLKTQTVLYEDAATAPDYHTPDGYTFVRWDKDFNAITENTDVTAVLTWTSEYPLEIDTVSKIVRNNKIYITTAIVNNSPNTVSNAKLLMALKTVENKQLAYVESAAFTMAAHERKTINLSVEYDGASTVGNLFVVEANDEKIPLSNCLVVAVDQGTAWSRWSTSTPPSDAVQQESRTEYRYRDKEFTTSTNSNLSGWTKRTDVTNPTTSYGNWGGWSAWQDSAVSSSDVCDVQTQSVWNGYSSWSGWSDWQDSWVGSNDYTDVETRNVNDQPIYETRYGYTTYYNYYRYANTNADTGGQGSYAYSSSYPYYRSYKLGSRLTEYDNNYAKTRYHYWYSSSNWVGVYECDPLETSEVTSSWQELTGYTQKTQYRYRTRTDTYKTQYRYRTRTKTVTYYYWRWKNWTDWGTTVYTGNSTREVQNRTTYRYISNDPKNIEDTSGVFQPPIVGALDPALFANKHAILHIYSSDGTVQFIGQTKLDANGAYSFTFKLKNDPTPESGNYRVLLSVEGTNAAIELDPILAPIPVYTVTFKDWDGTILSTQDVKKGENADVPEAPAHEGYKFVKWSKTPTNVSEDMVCTAVYAVRTFGVIFMDDLNGTKELHAFNYGDPLEVPEVTAPDGYNFLGWSVVAGTEVTENLVVNAQYERKTFEVKFLDFDDNEISVQNVEFGEPAIEPTLENNNGRIFLGWDIPYDINYVMTNMTVKPYFEYETTVDTPVSSIETGSYSSAQIVTLSTKTEGASIYYTTDGTYPLDTVDGSSPSFAPAKMKKSPTANNIKGTLYTGPFTLDNSAVLTFVAVKDGMNVSDYSENTYAINTENTTNTKHLVTIHYGLYDSIYSYLVDDNATVFDTGYGVTEYGYTLVGAYTDDTMTQAWNLESDKVNESVDIYLKWEKNIYKVIFLDKDGNIIEQQDVLYMESAKAPKWEKISVDGLIFTGWDKDYSSVFSDMTVKATYVANDSITNVSLDKTSVELKNDNTEIQLVASVTLGTNSRNNHVIWESEDESIALVDDCGYVKLLKDGTTTIYAISEDSGFSAECIVKHSTDCNHNYDTVVYKWNGEYCTATHICKLCEEDADGHIETETKMATYVKDIGATCIAAEKGHYEVNFDNASLGSAKTEKDSITYGSALGHSYGETAYVWNSLTCTATRTCTVCDESTQGHTETETKQGAYVKDTNASCTATEKGHYEVTFDNASLGSAKTEKDSVTNGSALGHTGGTANCVDKAICTRCKQPYGSVNTANHKSIVTDKAVAATCTATGLTEGRHCSACNTTIVKQTTIQTINHVDNNGDGKCDSCGYQMSDPTANCTCKCHQGGFNGFLWKILRIFYKLFGTKQYCTCGAKHW